MMTENEQLINDAIVRHDNEVDALYDCNSIAEVGEHWHIIIGFEYESDEYEIVNSDLDYITIRRISDECVSTHHRNELNLVEKISDSDGIDELQL